MSAFGKIPMYTRPSNNPLGTAEYGYSQAELERLQQEWQATQSMTTQPRSFQAWLEGRKKAQ